MPALRLGVDIGGTHTDIVLLNTDTGDYDIAKVPSTPSNPALGVLNGVDLLVRRGVDPGAIEFFAHGTTVTTNALLERKGVQVGLLVNEGFRGIQEVQTQHREGRSYNHLYRRPPGIASQHFTREIDGRIGFDGSELVALDEAVVRRAVAELADLGIRSFAVCYLFSFMNAGHERRTADIIYETVPGASVSLSSVVLPRIREWPRLSTTLVNAYLEPVLATYVASLSGGLDRAGVSTAQRFLMQSNGGVMPFQSAAAGGGTVRTLLSGPAAGVQATADLLGHQQHWKDLISFDMGGTSCDIAFIQNATPLETEESSVGHHTVDIPSFEIASISAGGGTIARVDAGNLLQIGPDSAGAVPGPACYGRGGRLPTITDMDLLCGFLDPDNFLGGTQKLDLEAARQAVRTVSVPLGMTEIEAAQGVVRLINARMADEVRVLAAKRAVDLTQFTLVPFGGAGPLHAAMVAQELGVQRVLVPPNPGAFSALGLLCTDVVHDYIRSDLKLIADVPIETARRIFDELTSTAQADLAREALDDRPRKFERTFDMRYAGQGYELPVAAADGEVNAELIAHAQEAFHHTHRALHGHASIDQPIEVVSYRLRVRVQVPRYQARPKPWTAPTQPAQEPAQRLAYFGKSIPTPTTLMQRSSLAPGVKVAGPAIIVQMDATTVVPPHWTAQVDQHGNLLLEAQS